MHEQGDGRVGDYRPPSFQRGESNRRPEATRECGDRDGEDPPWGPEKSVRVTATGTVSKGVARADGYTTEGWLEI